MDKKFILTIAALTLCATPLFSEEVVKKIQGKEIVKGGGDGGGGGQQQPTPEEQAAIDAENQEIINQDITQQAMEQRRGKAG